MTLRTPRGLERADVVLIVDDEPDILDSLRLTLEELGAVQVVTAANAKEGMSALKAGGIDLILSDHRMQGQDGLDFLREASVVAPDVPRILMTAYADVDLAVTAINDAHIHEFLRKPLDPDQVVEVVWRALDEHWERLETAARSEMSLDSLRSGRTGGPPAEPGDRKPPRDAP